MVRIFASIFIRDLVWFWYQYNAGIVEWVWKVSLLLNILEKFKKHWCYFFKCFVEFSSEGIWSWSFLIIDPISLLLVCLVFLFFPDSVLLGCMFVELYQFLWDYVVCWHTIVHSNLMILCNFVAPVVLSLLSFLILSLLSLS